MEVTKAFAAWAAETPAITSDMAMLRAQQAICDVVACMVAGAGDEGSARLRSTIAAYGSGSSTIIGSEVKAAKPWAALANGMSAHALDFDDNYLSGSTHATAVLIPALLGLAEEIDATGRQLMDAYEEGAQGPDPTARLPHKATISLKDGRILNGSCTWPRGTIHNPFDGSDLNEKYRDCCEGFLSPSDFEAVWEMLSNLSELDSVRRLTRHLAFNAGSDLGERFINRYDTETE